MGSNLADGATSPNEKSMTVATRGSSRRRPVKGSVFVVEDDELARAALEPLLEDAGYDVAFAENGCDALAELRVRSAPDIILFDLAMPTMNGWEFRAIQKNDPLLRDVPAVAITADGSPQAVAISADAYLRKPFAGKALLDTIERILEDRLSRGSESANTGDGLTALARLASAIGHEINNPLTIVLLNLGQAIEDLRPSLRAVGPPPKAASTDGRASDVGVGLTGIAEILADAKAGAERIRDTVAKLTRLTRKGRESADLIDIHALIDRSILRIWSKLSARTRLIKCYGMIPALKGDRVALEEVFVNLLVNAVEAIPAGAVDWNEIRIVTRLVPARTHGEVVVEIYDSGVGLSPQSVGRLFEPFFSTKPIGTADGTGLGLPNARQSVLDHGGRLTIGPRPSGGAVARVFLPITSGGELPRDDAPWDGLLRV